MALTYRMSQLTENVFMKIRSCSFSCGTGVKDDDAIFKKPREIMHKNTRLDRDPFSKALNKSQIQQAAALNAQVKVLLSYCQTYCPHM